MQLKQNANHESIQLNFSFAFTTGIKFFVWLIFCLFDFMDYTILLASTSYIANTENTANKVLWKLNLGSHTSFLFHKLGSGLQHCWRERQHLWANRHLCQNHLSWWSCCCWWKAARRWDILLLSLFPLQIPKEWYLTAVKLKWAISDFYICIHYCISKSPFDYIYNATYCTV